MTVRPFPVSPTLSAIAIAYKNPSLNLIYDKVLPKVAVPSEKFAWMEYPIEETMSLYQDAEVGRLGRVHQVTFSGNEQEDRVRDFGLEEPIPISDIDEARVQREKGILKFDPEAHGVESLTNLIQLGREVRAAAVVQDPSNYDVARRLALAGADKFSDFDNSDPFNVLNTAMTSPLVYRANTISMGQAVWEVLKRHPKMIKAVKGGLSEDGAINRQQLADLLELDVANVLIGVSMVNTAKKGQPVTLNRVWGNSIQFNYIDPNKLTSTDNVLTWGFTAELGGRISGSHDDPNIGLQGGRVIRVGERVKEVVCAKSLGYIVTNVI